MTVKVLIVDDSSTTRALIRRALLKDPQIEVVGESADPYEAREAIKKLNPDVITLDIEMPQMNGIEFLDKIMRLRPMPVIMISTLTQKGAKMAIDALAMGAFDCIGKPLDGKLDSAFDILPERIHAAAKTPVGNLGGTSAQTAQTVDFKPNGNLVAIGSSTGGVNALLQLIQQFPKNCPATVITQHMPAGFTASFASRLNSTCAPTVVEAQDNMPIQNGTIYLAPGGQNHLTVEGRHRRVCRVSPGDNVNGHAPSVDVLFDSVAPIGDKVVGVLLTGMGRDGATGLGKIRTQGGHTIGQDQASCVVYGMPRIAFEEGAVQQQLPLRKITSAILELCKS